MTNLLSCVLMPHASSSAPSFNLTTQTEEACGIKTQDNKFVITGGLDHSLADDALTRVTRYSRTGETETLADLNVGRFYHACGSYLTDQGEEVLLVTGGAEYAQGQFVHGWDDLASTEVLEDAAGAWRLTNPLPSVRKGLVAASVMNTIYVMGGHPHGGAYINDILQYNTEDHTWGELNVVGIALGLANVGQEEELPSVVESLAKARALVEE